MIRFKIRCEIISNSFNFNRFNTKGKSSGGSGLVIIILGSYHTFYICAWTSSFHSYQLRINLGINAHLLHLAHSCHGRTPCWHVAQRCANLILIRTSCCYLLWKLSTQSCMTVSFVVAAVTSGVLSLSWELCWWERGRVGGRKRSEDRRTCSCRLRCGKFSEGWEGWRMGCWVRCM